MNRSGITPGVRSTASSPRWRFCRSRGSTASPWLRPCLVSIPRELIQLLQRDQVSPIALGLHSRRLLKRLVTDCLQQCGNHQQRGLINGIQELRSLGLEPWLLSCMHKVRTFGNWMGHPQDTGPSRRVEQHDVLATLCSLQRILANAPWITPPASPGRPSEQTVVVTATSV